MTYTPGSDPMDTTTARDYIPQWGSDGSGAIAYSTIPPESPEARDSLVAYLRDECRPLAIEEGATDGDEYEWSDVEMIDRAIEYLESIDYGAQLKIEICPNEPRASAYLADGREVSADPRIAAHLADCRASGDVQPACEYVRDSLGVEFRILARNAAGAYENRLATDAELEATARAIYFDSDSDFTNRDTAAMYLIWQAAADAENEESEG